MVDIRTGQCCIIAVNIYSIYTFTNSITGKKYVGYTCDIKTRLKSHKSSLNKGVKTKLYDAIRSYGWNNFNFDVIYQSTDSIHTLKVMENYFINEYNSYNNGYNMTLGGDGAIGTTSWCKGKHPAQLLWDEDRKQKHSKILKDMWDDNKKKMLSEKWTDDMKEEQRNKSILAWKSKIDHGYSVKVNNKFLVCPHCDKTNNIGNSKRWHFDNCKLRK